MRPAIDLLTVTRPSAIADLITSEMATTRRQDGIGVITPRTFLRDSLVAQTLGQTQRQGWLSPRIYTSQTFLGEYTRRLRGFTVLSEIQVREIIAGLVRDESLQALDPRSVQTRAVSEATLKQVTNLVMELESQAADVETVRNRMKDAAGRLSPHGSWLADIYERYRARLDECGIVGPMGRSLTAIEAARTEAPPQGLRDMCFVGLDGLGAGDISIRLMLALAENPCVERVRIMLVVPDGSVESAWAHHGNESLLAMLADRGVSPRKIVMPVKTATALETLATDPFAYRLPSAEADSTVQAVQLPDPRLEAAWIAGDIKRRLIEDPALTPEDCAIILRDPSRDGGLIIDALETRGLPMVASSERLLDTIPFVRAHLECVRLVSQNWPAFELLSLAESPYVKSRIAPQALLAVITSGPAPSGTRQWRERLIARAETERTRSRMGGEGISDAAVAAAETAEGIEQLSMQLSSCLPSVATPTQWVASMASMREVFEFDKTVMTPAGNRARAEAGRLVRLDIDGANAMWKAARDWERGRELAGRANEILTLDQWERELTALCHMASVRVSTYPRDAVHIVEPDQAALRSWKVVYIAGLSDGVFPPRLSGGTTEEERLALALPLPDERAAVERLRFHLACASATENLICTAPSADISGTMLAASPYLIGLPLRINGCSIIRKSASDLAPSNDDSVWSLDEADVRAVQHLRDGHTVSDSSFLAAWASRRGSAVSRRWRQADLRHKLDQLLAQGAEAVRLLPEHNAAGLIAAENLPFANPEAIFDTRDLTLYNRCHFRWFTTRVLSLESDGPENEAAAIGRLSHEVMGSVLRRGREEGIVPPTSAAQMDTLLAYSDKAVAEATEKYLSGIRQKGWRDDVSRLQTRLRATMRRDMGRWLTPETTEIRTRIEALSTTIGSALHPVEFTVDGVTFRMRGTIDRTETIDDPRLPEAVQGQLIISDYTSSQSAASQATISAAAKGKAPHLPLLAALAQRQFDTPVFAARTIVAADGDDPDILARSVVTEAEDGTIALMPVKKRGLDADPLEQAIKASLSAMAEMVHQVRAGNVAPQPGRTCQGCPLISVCRASTATPGLNLSSRTPEPIVVELAAP